ncbi:MAG: hypothetical protein JSW59_18075 [Phycisphaerales bacterium]|nr:MAG: hypothetical protein JSW59_18075 [Phycisphaerales bacterium]
MKAAVATALLICMFDSVMAQAAEQQDSRKATVIVVIGAAGAPEYEQQFAQWTRSWEQACSKGDVNFVAIGLDQGAEPGDREILQDTLAKESRETKAELWLVLIGHGTFDGRTAKFNLRGPDVSAKDLADWLNPVLRPTAVINCASASAPFLVKLSAPGRVVITATKSGFEHNYARFGQHLARAIAEPQADLDKDGQTSLLEAFLTASGRVDEFYSAQGWLVTEHALLDDNGDGLGTRADWFRGIRPVQKAQDDAPLDGYRTHQFHLVLSRAERKMPLDLRAQRDRLELEVMKLRDAREEFSEEEYFSKLEALLYQITEIYEQTDEPNEVSG